MYVMLTSFLYVEPHYERLSAVLVFFRLVIERPKGVKTLYVVVWLSKIGLFLVGSERPDLLYSVLVGSGPHVRRYSTIKQALPWSYILAGRVVCPGGANWSGRAQKRRSCSRFFAWFEVIIVNYVEFNGPAFGFFGSGLFTPTLYPLQP